MGQYSVLSSSDHAVKPPKGKKCPKGGTKPKGGAGGGRVVRIARRG